MPLLVKSGNWNAVQVLQDTHVFRSAGFELLEHLHFDEVVPQLPKPVAEQHMAGTFLRTAAFPGRLEQL